jgi:lysophospholipase L1-like esterase
MINRIGVPLKRVAFALIVVILFFLAIEGGLRLVGYRGDLAVMDYRLQVTGEILGEPDPVLFWRLKGVRPQFEEKGARVISLGDSVIVMEHGQGWPDKLPGALKRSGYADPVQVFNAGVPGYNSHQGLLYLQTELLALKPNLVSIEYAWNDHTDSQCGVPDREMRMPSGAMLALQSGLAKSNLYQLLRTAIADPIKPNGTSRVPLPQYLENMTKMVQLVRGQGGQTVFVAPVYLATSPYLSDRHLPYLNATRELAEQLNVEYVDLTERFAQAPDLFLDPERDPVHVNAAGSDLLAEAVAGRLVEKGLLP